MSEPTTNTGIRLRQWLLYPDRSYAPHEIAIHAADDIAAIEQEARAELAARIEAAIRAESDYGPKGQPRFTKARALSILKHQAMR